MWAAHYAPQAVPALLDHGADVNAVTSEGATPLSAAACSDPETVRLLIGKGANASAGTPVAVAEGCGKTDILRVLLDNGADVNAKGALGVSALEWAILHGHSDAALLLIEKGANVNAEDYNRGTPLITAAGLGLAGIVRILLDKGANVSAETFLGETALMEAVRHGDPDTVHVLLEKGADPTRALHVAAENGRSDLVQMLKNPASDPATLLAMQTQQANAASAAKARGDDLYAKGQYERAIQEYDRALQLNPDLAEAYVGKKAAHLRMGQGDPDGDNDHAVNAFSRRARGHVSKAEYDLAIADYSGAIWRSADPAKELALAGLLMERGDAYVKQGSLAKDFSKYDRAIEDYSEVIRLSPLSWQPFRRRAYAHELKGESGLAKADNDAADYMSTSHPSADYVSPLSQPSSQATSTRDYGDDKNKKPPEPSSNRNKPCVLGDTSAECAGYTPGH